MSPVGSGAGVGDVGDPGVEHGDEVVGPDRRRDAVGAGADRHRAAEERLVGDDWVVSIDRREFPARVAADHDGATVTVAGKAMRIVGDWLPGQPLAHMTVDGTPLVLKVGRLPAGFRLRVRGADLKVRIRTPRAAELARLMPEKAPPDTSRFLLCPMPGLVVNIAVAEGDEVHEGQALATVEAMKMENTLRAERKGTVKTIRAEPGQSLKVDDVILEFA